MSHVRVAEATQYSGEKASVHADAGKLSLCMLCASCHPCVSFEYETKESTTVVRVLVSWLEGCQIIRNNIFIAYRYQRITSFIDPSSHWTQFYCTRFDCRIVLLHCRHYTAKGGQRQQSGQTWHANSGQCEVETSQDSVSSLEHRESSGVAPV